MELLDIYNQAESSLFDYFGYKEDWAKIPVDGATQWYWNLTGESYGDEVRFGEKDDVLNLTGEHFVNEVYTQRFLPKWVYRGENYTMICVDTHTDGNKFLQIFANDKELKEGIINNEN